MNTMKKILSLLLILALCLTMFACDLCVGKADNQSGLKATVIADKTDNDQMSSDDKNIQGEQFNQKDNNNTNLTKKASLADDTFDFAQSMNDSAGITATNEPSSKAVKKLGKTYSVKDNLDANGVTAFSNHYYGVPAKTIDGISSNLGLAYSLTLSDDATIAKTPKGYNKDELIEWGKDPGLGVRILHQQGYTGKGAVIAYVDQALGPNLHEQFKALDLTYTNNAENSASMHGPAVLSLLAGKDIGTAPGTKVYYYSFKTNEQAQVNEAECLYQIIELNKTLPDDQKITMVGFSDNIDSNEANPEAFEAAAKACEEAGILVWFCGEYGAASFLPMSDKSTPENLTYDEWVSRSYSPKLVYVPASGRTAANSFQGSKYTYWATGGLSWTMPYMLGLYAIIKEIDPSLTADGIRELVVDTAYTNTEGLKLVNPIELVATTLEKVGENTKADTLRKAYFASQNYIYAVMDTAAMDSKDLTAVANYLSALNNGTVLVIDAAKYSKAREIYDVIKADHETRGGKIAGIQIFGTADMVPAFEVKYKVQMKDSIDEGGVFLSDLFYGNLNNDSAKLATGYSVQEHFNNNWNIDLIPEWPVVRLPLKNGEYSNFFKKYKSFAINTGLEKQTLVNFSNPIFQQKEHSDDMSTFLNRLKNELKVIDSNYRLYGNLRGECPVITPTLGGFTKENLSSENSKGTMELLINSHGQRDNIDCCYFENSEEKRESLINSSNINTVLNSNPYYLDCWTCNNGYAMGNNLISTALNGSCVGAFAATTVISNNGVDSNASLEDMKKSNFYYFYYAYLRALNDGNSRANSFLIAQRAYAKALLDCSKQPIAYERNYQFNLCNLLAYENFGVLEPNVATLALYNNKGYISQAGQSVPKTTNSGSSNKGGSSGQTSTPSIQASKLSDGQPVGEKSSIKFTTSVDSPNVNQYEFYDYRVQKLDNDMVRCEIELKAPKEKRVSAFNPPQGDKFMLRSDYCTGERQTITYDVKLEDIKSVDSITMRVFGGGDEERVFAFVNTSEILSAIR